MKESTAGQLRQPWYRQVWLQPKVHIAAVRGAPERGIAAVMVMQGVTSNSG